MSIGGRYVGTPATRQKIGQIIPFTEAPPSVCENFPNDGVLGVVTSDQTWNDPFSGLSIVGAELVTDSGYGQNRMEVDAGSTDHAVSVTVTATKGISSSGDNLYLIGRAGDAGDIGSDNGVAFYADDTGYVDLGSWSTGSVVTDTGVGGLVAEWRLECEGDEVRGYRDGVLLLTADASTFPVPPAGTRGGLALASGSSASSVPTTITESFNTSNGTTIGPDISWSKSSYTTGGTPTNSGVINSNAFAVVGNPVGDKFAQCKITNNGFNGNGTTVVEATVAARSAVGTSSGQVDYSSFFLHDDRVAFIVSNPGGVEQVRIFETGGTASAWIPAAWGVGDVLRLEVVGPFGSCVATGKINGSTVVTWPLFVNTVPANQTGCEIEVSCVSQANFTADNQDRLDSFSASGELTVSTYPTALDHFCLTDL